MDSSIFFWSITAEIGRELLTVRVSRDLSVSRAQYDLPIIIAATSRETHPLPRVGRSIIENTTGLRTGNEVVHG
jgi:hypothetical protein